MRQQQFGGPKLPKELRDKFRDPVHQTKYHRGRDALLNRKDRRKVERSQKKAQKRQPRANNDPQRPASESDEDEEDLDLDAPPLPLLPPPEVTETPGKPETSIRSILKKPLAGSLSQQSDGDALPSPQHVPKAVKDRIAEDDAEIQSLEKKLGIKGKRRSKPGADGLDGIFGDLDAMYGDDNGEEELSAKRKRDPDDDEWLASKRRNAFQGTGSDLRKSPRRLDAFNDQELDDEQDNGDEAEDKDIGTAGDESNDDSSVTGEADGEEDWTVSTHVRENPYIAPLGDNISRPTKYVPPALRAPATETEALARLKRNIQGLLNRLSDANMLVILRDVEQVYQNNARGYVNSTLIDLILGLLADESALLDTFLILHAGFITAVYKIIGTDFGALTIERIVVEIDRNYDANKHGHGKQTANLISVLAVLYNFQVIGANLVFDYVKRFLDKLSEFNTELLLRIIRHSGTQLRQDDPTSLKDIVLLLQKSVASVGERNLPVRTKFMIETINNLKNNRMKTGLAASAIISEHTVKMKKQLGSLNNRNLKSTEPLRIGLADIQNTDKKGKWWLVGASWRDDIVSDRLSKSVEMNAANEPSTKKNKDDENVDLLQLAKEQRMNTDVRRAVFVSIMSATDFKDAHNRLVKLNLKKSQEVEIPRVIVHCAGCETSYNPYYTLLARQFCSDHKSRKCFQFALWDIFRNLGGKEDRDVGAEDEEPSIEQDLSLRKLVNLGKLYGTLIARGDLPITSLKPLDFSYLKPKTKMFAEIMLVTIILESQKGVKGGRDAKGLLNIFINTDSALDMVPGLQYFFKKVISRTDITANSAERDAVRWACRVVGDMLARLSATMTVDEN